MIISEQNFQAVAFRCQSLLNVQMLIYIQLYLKSSLFVTYNAIAVKLNLREDLKVDGIVPSVGFLESLKH